MVLFCHKYAGYSDIAKNAGVPYANFELFFKNA